MHINTHFPDLTSYSHQIAPFTLVGVKNVGWLDFESEFSLGEMPMPVFEKLKNLARGTGIFQPLVEPIREALTCHVCGGTDLFDSAGKVLPNAELWIPAEEIIYASPIMILHFIEAHNYLPPAEFIAAIDAVDESIPFVAEEIYREKLRQSEWGKLSGIEKRALAAAQTRLVSDGSQSQD